jgi:hypothetical protein
LIWGLRPQTPYSLVPRSLRQKYTMRTSKLWDVADLLLIDAESKKAA